MEILNKGKYLRVKAEQSELQPYMLLGWSRRQDWLTVEDNLVNRFVLGLNPNVETYGDYLSWRERMETAKTNEQPGNPKEKLEQYQINDVLKMCCVKHILNANPMGLGKTVETISYLRTIGAKSVLIVVPKILRYQWASQIKLWWGRDSEVYEKQKTVEPGKIWIINYDKLRNDQILDRFRRFRWDVVILDEAHKVKNRKSKQSMAVKCLPADRKVALTGTPILSYADDLWGIFNFLDESYSGVSYWTFLNYFCKIQHTPWGDKIIGLTDDKQKLQLLEKVKSFVCIRNNKVQVAHGKTRETVRLPMTAQQRVLYKKEKKLMLDELPEGLTIANGAVLSMRLRQTTSWPGLYLKGVAGPKFEWILELCKNNESEKIVVFSVFEKSVSGLVSYLIENGVSAVSITGKNKQEENEINKSAFIDRDVQVLAGTIGAMGQGYDGLQNVSHTLVFIDREWSPEIMAQAEDRLHRMGQSSPVNIYYLECQGSFDQHVGRINKTKADDIRRALQDDVSD